MGSNYNKHESKYFHTAQLMDEALLNLLETKDFEYITVSQLCKKAGVNRTTFYLHYLSMDDLLKETLEYKSSLFANKFKGITISSMNTAKQEDYIFLTPKYIIPYLEYIKENKKLFLLTKKKPAIFKSDIVYKNTLEEIVFPILDKFNVKKEEQKYVSAFYISGIQAIIMEWIKNECEDEINDICNLIMRIVLKK